MSEIARIAMRRDVDRAKFESEIVPTSRPVVLQGLCADWPLVRAARESRENIAAILRGLDAGLEPFVVETPPRAQGRIFFGDDLAGFNFTRARARIGDTLERLLRHVDDPAPPGLFLESLPAADYLPSFAASHPMPLLDSNVAPRVWIGNAVKVNTHFDLAYNIACVCGGRRRFTLFPPAQLANLYIAPLDFTPSGAPVSLVQLTDPDHARFPRFREALRHALVAELEPGDALYIPFGWWHHVESLAPFNVLVNYWWNSGSAHGSPLGALMHSLLAIRDLPADQRDVWASLFHELVFTDPASALEHLPPARRGLLGPPSAERTRGIREKLAREFQRPGD